MGGEAPILVRTKDGKVYAIAGVGTMPKLATADFFRNHTLHAGRDRGRRPAPKGMKDWVPVAGILCALVPGMVDAALVALRDFGTKSFCRGRRAGHRTGRRLPHRRVARHVRHRQQRRICRAMAQLRSASSCRNGRAPQPGEIFRQPDLARTLRSMAEAEKKALAAGASARQGHRRGARLLLPRRDRPPHRRVLQGRTAACCATRTWRRSTWRRKKPVSTTFHGYTVYKPGFWSQGPAMIEALNILEGFDLAEHEAEFGRLHPHAGGSAEAGLRRSRHLLRRPEVQQDSRREAALQGVRRGAAQADRRTQASLEFRPGEDRSRIRRSIPCYAHIAHHKIDPALLAKDTTCVDAIDKDGVAISITPSGAWMPSVIAGDTGIPLTERAQSFLLVPGHPNELARRQAPARDAQPHHRGQARQEP